MGWLIDETRLTSCETVPALREELVALADSGVPIGAVLDRFNLAAWYHQRLTE